MLRYGLKRGLLLIPTLLLVSFLIFSISRLVPGDIVELMITEQSYADDVAALRAKLGLDKPLLAQYGVYLKGFFQGEQSKGVRSALDSSGSIHSLKWIKSRPLLKARRGNLAFAFGLTVR